MCIISVSGLFKKWNSEDGLDRNMKDTFLYLFVFSNMKGNFLCKTLFLILLCLTTGWSPLVAVPRICVGAA